MKGFSLVELSIVLVILGLLTGGILSGQALIRAAELRSLTTDVHKYVTAVQTFRDKYMALPGDFNKATLFWGPAASCPGDYTTPSTTITTCDGTGNGIITTGPIGATNYSERHRFWQHLANAGLIEGTYSGVPANGTTSSLLAGTNAPTLRLKNAGIAVVDSSDGSASHFYKDGLGTHQLHLIPSGGTTLSTAAGVISTEEAWNIDAKVDDGRPGFGKVRPKKAGATGTPTCSSNADPALAEYALTTTGIQCNLIFDTGF